MRGIVLGFAFGTVLVASSLVGGTANADEDAAATAPATEVAQAHHAIEVTLAQMSLVAFHVREDLRVTRKLGTKVQIACVDQALSRADVATRRARETAAETMDAYGRGDTDAARAALHRLSELREVQRIAGLSGAQCSAARRNVTRTATTVTMAAPAP